MTGVTSNLRTSPALRDLAISTLEKMQREADEEVRLFDYEALNRGPESARQQAHRHARRVRQALRWTRGQALGGFRFLLLLLLKYYAILFAVGFGFDLWNTYTTQVIATPDFEAMAFNSAERALLAGTIFGLMEWWNGRRACVQLLEPVLASEELKRAN